MAWVVIFSGELSLTVTTMFIRISILDNFYEVSLNILLFKKI